MWRGSGCRSPGLPPRKPLLLLILLLVWVWTLLFFFRPTLSQPNWSNSRLSNLSSFPGADFLNYFFKDRPSFWATPSLSSVFSRLITSMNYIELVPSKRFFWPAISSLSSLCSVFFSSSSLSYLFSKLPLLSALSYFPSGLPWATSLCEPALLSAQLLHSHIAQGRSIWRSFPRTAIPHSPSTFRMVRQAIASCLYPHPASFVPNHKHASRSCICGLFRVSPTIRCFVHSLCKTNPSPQFLWICFARGTSRCNLSRMFAAHSRIKTDACLATGRATKTAKTQFRTPSSFNPPFTGIKGRKKPHVKPSDCYETKVMT